MSIKKLIARAGIKAAKKSAVTTAKYPSKYGYHQPKEPENLQEMLRKKN